jgi:CRISPR system Cascade subunit CasD
MAESFLVFQLGATIGSFGVGAGNFSRGTQSSPGHSLIVGLIGAALGLDREDARLLDLSDGLRVAVAMDARGPALRDFHTVQSRPEKRGERPRTRKEALEIGEPYTTLSERDYFCDVLANVAVSRTSGPISLTEMAQALRRPAFTLYLGRKSCPLALPAAPDLIEAEAAHEALRAYRDRMRELEPLFPVRRRAGQVEADARLYPKDGHSPRSRRRTAPAQRSIWAYRLLEELTLDPGAGAR